MLVGMIEECIRFCWCKKEGTQPMLVFEYKLNKGDGFCGPFWKTNEWFE